MEPEMAADWPMIIEILKWIFYIGGGVAALFGQVWAVRTWLEKKFGTLEAKRAEDVLDRNKRLEELEEDAIARHRQLDTDLVKSRQDLTQLRNDMQLKLADTLTRDQLEAVLDRRIGRFEGKLESLIVELARLGVQGRNPNFPKPYRGRDDDDDQG